MKAGRTLGALAEEVKRQQTTRVDYLADTRRIKMDHGESAGAMLIDTPKGVELFRPTKWAHGQLAEKTGIPMKYYNRMLEEQPDLLARNVNAWLHADPSV